MDDSHGLNRIARTFNRQFNSFYVRFGAIQNVELMKHLFVSFCSSFYGIEILDPRRVSVSSLKFWRKSMNLALMKLLRLPRESVSQFLIAEGILNADSAWSYRSLIFWKNVLETVSPHHPLRECNQNRVDDLLLKYPEVSNSLSASRLAIRDVIVVDWGLRKEIFF